MKDSIVMLISLIAISTLVEKRQAFMQCNEHPISSFRRLFHVHISDTTDDISFISFESLAITGTDN